MNLRKIMLAAATLSVAGVMVFGSAAGAAAAEVSAGSENFDISNVTVIQKYAADMLELSDEQIELYDFTGDGIVDISDATCLQKEIAEIIDLSEPVLNKNEITFEIGESETLSVTIRRGLNANGIWESSNSSVAEVDENGKVTANSSGTAVVSYTLSNGASASCTVTVNDYPTPELNKSTVSLKVGQYTTLSATANGVSNSEGTWTSSNSYVAEVDGDGKVFAKFNGTAEITYTMPHGESASCTVTVAGTAAKCLDVSEWNGDIDFDDVKAAGYEYVIIRAGYGNGIGDNGTDTNFEENYAAAKKAGLKVGVYWYCYAMSVDGAKLEVTHCTKILNGKQLDLPLYFDVEDTGYTLSLDDSTIQNIIITFCEGMKDNGYTNVGVYSSASVLLDRLDLQDLESRGYSIWSAEWNDEAVCSVDCDIWQYASDGRVDGISYDVDLDYIYNLNILKK